MSDEALLDPVHVIEAIPVAGDNEVTAAEIARESIPTPAHLRIFKEMARGGMGRIHPATDRNLLRHVALKRLDKQLAKVPFYRDGFIAEAQMAGQLEHPNIVPVHELALDRSGVPYFTMKLVNGLPLHHWLRQPERPLGSTQRLDDALTVFLKVCDAVAYAHHRGVIHRDIKPENVMVAEFGQVYLMDWGLARLTKTRPASGKQALMETSGPVGTPGYMPPEQARGNPAEMSELCDVFGLGALLYEIASGKLPFAEASTDQVLADTRAGKVVPIEHAIGGLNVPKRLCAIIARATQADPRARYDSVIALQRDVQSFLRGGLHLPRRSYAAGELILREGDRGDAAYMITSGRCRAFRTTGTGQETLTMMQTGDVFGEMALLLDEPRSASVEAAESVTVLVLDKQTMNEGLGFDGWTGALVRALAQRFRDLEQTVRSSGMRRT